MIDLSNIQVRDKDRARHEKMIAEFLASGGQIQVIEKPVHRPEVQGVWNGGITPKTDHRREYEELERQIAEHGRALAATGLTAEQALRQLKKKWGERCVLNKPKIEQLGARFGYYYPDSGRGRP